MTLHAGAPGVWQLAVDLVADGSVDVPGNTGTDIALDTRPSAATTDAGLHSYFLVSAYVKADGVVVQIAPVMDTPGVYPLDLFCGLIRTYAGGPPATVATALRIRNLGASTQTIAYRVYKWRGLQ